MPRSIQITLRNLRFHVLVGILPHERELPQPLEIDLTVQVQAAPSGAITVDYRDLHAVVTTVIAGPELLYLEDIAQRITEGALRHEFVTGARTAVRKPHVPLGSPLDHVEVVVQDGDLA